MNCTATSGTIQTDTGQTIRYTAPASAGEYQLTAILDIDGSVQGKARITVIDGSGGEGPCDGLIYIKRLYFTQ